MDKNELAQSVFKDSFNCAQSVLAAFAPDYGLARNDALRVAGALGGGVARMGETCGAVIGALIVIGLKHGMIRPGDLETKEDCYERSRIFVDKFMQRRGRLKCRELLGYDPGNPAEAEIIKARDLHQKLCTGFIRDAVEILEEML